MIDEELYQQAADELNSDRRCPNIWARACALASNDHDEARYLYTNLRVEELIAERGQVSDSSPADLTSDISYDVDSDSNADTNPEGLLSLGGDGASEANDIDDFLTEFKADQDYKPPNDYGSVSSGGDNPAIGDDLINLESSLEEKASALPDDPDKDLLVDYVPEEFDSLDDTYSGEGLAEEDFQQELASFKAEESKTKEPETDNVVLTLAEEESAANAHGVDPLEETGQFTEAPPISADEGDLTQANLSVLDAHADDLDELLGDAGYEALQPVKADPDMQWLESDPPSTSMDTDSPAQANEPLIYEDDPYTDDLNRQADELELSPTSDQATAYSQRLADEMDSGENFSESASLPTVAGPTEAEIPNPVDTNPVVAAATGAAAAGYATSTMSSGAPATWPLDLTTGHKGKLFNIYRNNNKAQAVKSGVSWSAMLFTLPYLLYRQLFGTAFAYLALWLVAVGGLIISGLAWLDAGAEVEPLIQACTIGFALLAFIGMVYLPFRYGNTWRSERLENRGFELVAVAKAKNPGKAIALARQHSALES